ENAALNVLDRRPDDGGAEQEGADQRADAGDEVALLEEPIDKEGVDDEEQAGHRLLEADRCVFVVVGATRALFRAGRVVVLVRAAAYQRCNLHKTIFATHARRASILCASSAAGASALLGFSA